MARSCGNLVAAANLLGVRQGEVVVVGGEMNGVLRAWRVLHPPGGESALLSCVGARWWWWSLEGDEWRRRRALDPPIQCGVGEEGLAARRASSDDA